MGVLLIKRYENELMSSNCYIVSDSKTKSCVVIDPASVQATREIDYIEQNGLHLNYIIVTHEHTDHTWGVNTLKLRFPDTKIVCSESCDKKAKKESKAYFLFYYNNSDYCYEMLPADVLIKEQETVWIWSGHKLRFLLTPGHSEGSMCFEIDECLFTGDFIMPFPPHINRRYSKMEDYQTSIKKIIFNYPKSTLVYPGHGEVLTLNDWMQNKEWSGSLIINQQI